MVGNVLLVVHGVSQRERDDLRESRLSRKHMEKLMTAEAIARSIPDDVPVEALQTHRSNVEEWLKKAVAAEALAARMVEQEKLPMLPEIAWSVAMKRLSAESHARVFRSMAARAQGIYDRLIAQKSLYDANLAKEVAELRRMLGDSRA